MGRVIEFDAWKRDRRLVVRPDGSGQELRAHRGRRDPTPLARLERAVARLERLVRDGSGRIGARVEAELLAITKAVAGGRIDDAATGAERLAERLEHPSSRAAR